MLMQEKPGFRCGKNWPADADKTGLLMQKKLISRCGKSRDACWAPSDHDPLTDTSQFPITATPNPAGLIQRYRQELQVRHYAPRYSFCKVYAYEQLQRRCFCVFICFPPNCWSAVKISA